MKTEIFYQFQIINLMKTLVTLLFVFCVLTLSAQNLKNDCKFQKSVNLIYSSMYQYDEVKRDNSLANKSIMVLENNLFTLKKLYSDLKDKHSNDEDFKEYENWVLTLDKSLIALQGDDSLWQMGYTLVKLNLNDFMKLKY